MSRDIEIRITAAAQTGFVAHEAGEIVAAFSTRHELARWIEERLGDLSGETSLIPEEPPRTMPRVVNEAGWKWGRR